MLEQGECLRTWALGNEPRDAIDIAAEALADHRLLYLSHEGPVSGDRGRVMQWDAGEYELLAQTADELRCELRGRQLQGVVTLTRASADDAGDQRWMFRFRNK